MSAGRPTTRSRIGARFPITLLNTEPLEAGELGAHYTLLRGSGLQLNFADRQL